MNAEFLREAIRLSLEKMRVNEGGPFGAVIVKDGRIVGRGDATSAASSQMIRCPAEDHGGSERQGANIAHWGPAICVTAGPH